MQLAKTRIVEALAYIAELTSDELCHGGLDLHLSSAERELRDGLRELGEVKASDERS